MPRCVILSACPISGQMAAALRPDDHLIACDAGYRSCQVLGRRPDAVVGDFDSAPRPQALPWEELVVLPHVKDDTDTEYAAKLASREGYREVLMLGCLGGSRLEHTLANLCTGLGLEQRGCGPPFWMSTAASPICCRDRAAPTPKGNISTCPSFPWKGGPPG